MILVALASAATEIVSSVSAPDNQLTPPSGGIEQTFWSLWTLAAIPLAFAMPRLRASFFGWGLHVPSYTYALPRWMVRCCIGAMIGQAAGLLVLVVARDYRVLWLAGSLTLIGEAFRARARGRLKKHPSTEFTMRWWRCR